MVMKADSQAVDDYIATDSHEKTIFLLALKRIIIAVKVWLGLCFLTGKGVTLSIFRPSKIMLTFMWVRKLYSFFRVFILKLIIPRGDFG